MDEVPEGLDPSLNELNTMEIITIIRTPTSFRVEASVRSQDALLASLARAIVYQCLDEWEVASMDEEDEFREGSEDA